MPFYKSKVALGVCIFSPLSSGSSLFPFFLVFLFSFLFFPRDPVAYIVHISQNT